MNIYYLSKAQYNELLENGSTTLSGGETIDYSLEDVYCIPDENYRHHIMLTDSEGSIITTEIYSSQTTPYTTRAELLNLIGGGLTASGFDKTNNLAIIDIFDNDGDLYANGYDALTGNITDISMDEYIIEDTVVSI